MRILWKISILSLLLMVLPAQSEGIPNRVEAVLDAHGRHLMNASKQLVGTLTLAGGSPLPFRISIEGYRSRTEYGIGEGAMTTVKNGRRGVQVRNGRSGHVDSTPDYAASFNLIPFEALVRFHQNPLYSMTAVTDDQGNSGLRFEQQEIQQQWSPSPRYIVTFRLDENSRIVELSYTDTRGKMGIRSYLYSYESVAGSPFLQPGKITALGEGRTLYEATATRAQANVLFPPKTFDIEQ